MIKRDACLWGWEEGGEGRRTETHGLLQMWSQQDVLGRVIPSLWLLAFFRLLVSLQLNDGYLFQVPNPLTVWNLTLCHAENLHTRARTYTHMQSMCVHKVSLLQPRPHAVCLAVLLPSGTFLSWQKSLFLSQSEPGGKVCMKKSSFVWGKRMSYIIMTMATICGTYIYCTQQSQE